MSISSPVPHRMAPISNSGRQARNGVIVALWVQFKMSLSIVTLKAQQQLTVRQGRCAGDHIPGWIMNKFGGSQMTGLQINVVLQINVDKLNDSYRPINNCSQ